MKDKKVLIVVSTVSLIIFVILAISFLKSRDIDTSVDGVSGGQEPRFFSGIYDPNEAMNRFPKESLDHFIAGRRLYTEKNFDAAIIEFNKAIDIFESAESYCELGLSYMELKKFDVAIEKLSQSSKLNPIYPKSEYALAVAYALTLPPQADKSREHYERAKELGYNIPDWFKSYLLKLESVSK